MLDLARQQEQDKDPSLGARILMRQMTAREEAGITLPYITVLQTRQQAQNGVACAKTSSLNRDLTTASALPEMAS